MNAVEQELLWHLQAPLVTAMALVGSRVTCDPPPVDTDQDVLVLAGANIADLVFLLYNLGFSIDGSQVVDPVYHLANAEAFQSFSRGELNLIVTQDAGFYHRFLVATQVAKRLNVLDKADRIALFQAVLYGNPVCDKVDCDENGKYPMTMNFGGVPVAEPASLDRDELI